MEQRIVAYGGAVKALTADGSRIGGYLVEWGEAGTRDLQRERFVSATDFALDWYGERPLLFHHGLDGGIGAAKIGTIRRLSRDDKGLWMEAILDERNEYIEYVRRLIDLGALGLSSGSLPQLVDVDADGTIRRFPIVEGSLTHTPADPRTQVVSLKAQITPTPPRIQGGETDGELFVGTRRCASAPSDEQENSMEAVMKTIEATLGITLSPEQRAALTEQLTTPLPQPTAPANKSVIPFSRVQSFTGITEMKDLRYHHLKAQDLVFGAHILNAARRSGLSLGGASDGFLRAAADKTLRAADYAGYGDGYAVKAAIKADEVFSIEPQQQRAELGGRGL